MPKQNAKAGVATVTIMRPGVATVTIMPPLSRHVENLN
jgi:hypothetical protein